MTQDLPPCTVETCDRPTQEHLCAECVTELQDAYDQIPPLLPVLEAISRNEDVAFGQPTAGGRGGATGSRPPMNLSAYQLHVNLRQALVFTPSEYATHDDGAWSKWMIEDQVKRADVMVNGEKEDKPTPDYVAYRLRDIHPMPVKHLLPWLAEKTGIRLNKQNIKDWARRGKLERRNDSGHPTYAPADVLAAHASDGRSS